MKAECPSDPSHNTFYTTVHTVEEWKVDREGNFLALNDTLEVLKGPSREHTWECGICGCRATVK